MTGNLNINVVDEIINSIEELDHENNLAYNNIIENLINDDNIEDKSMNNNQLKDNNINNNELLSNDEPESDNLLNSNSNDEESNNDISFDLNDDKIKGKDKFLDNLDLYLNNTTINKIFLILI